MAKRQYRTPLQCKKATEAKLRRAKMTVEEAASLVRGEIQDDLKELTSGTPTGKARKKLLRERGYPFARRAGKSGLGRQRGTMPTLPIGIGEGRLNQSAYAMREGTKITAGFSSRAGSSIYVVVPSGTSKMIGRNLWGPNEGGELGKRIKARRKALEDVLFPVVRS